VAFNPITTVTEGTFAASNPSELDYLRPNGFTFQVHNMPNVSFFCQAANIPEISMGYPTQVTPLVDIAYPGDKLQFGELMIRFLIQEDMTNYNELYSWLRGLGFPDKHSEFTDYIKSQTYRTAGANASSREGIAQVSDATLFVLDSNNNPNVKITFKDAFPISLSGLDFDIANGTGDYFIGIASFKYRIFEIEKVA
jgi:hypothetical protein|tara:strand:- start:50 stop:637 length:588 start_codon:yes stop_codon:yes gene_type:complete